MDKKMVAKYLLAAIILLAIGYGLGLVYSGLKTKAGEKTLAAAVPGFDKTGEPIVYPTVNMFTALVRENRAGQNLIIVEIAKSTPSLEGTPLVRWVTVTPETAFYKTVRTAQSAELQKITQAELKPGDRVTIDGSPNNIRVAKEFTATSVTLDLPDSK